jgi:hypothetical protein
MNKAKLTLLEVYQLDSELSGSVNRENGTKITKGLLSQSLNLKVKYWLNKLKTTTSQNVELIDKLRDEFITKHGEKDDKGNVSLPLNITEKNEENQDVQKLNPKFIEFNTELDKLLKEEKDIEVYAFSIDDFENLQTEETYPIFFKLIEISLS